MTPTWTLHLTTPTGEFAESGLPDFAACVDRLSAFLRAAPEYRIDAVVRLSDTREACAVLSFVERRAA